MVSYQEIKERLRRLLPEERFLHSERVEKCAEDLARKNGVDGEKARIAGLLHDCSRYLDRAGMLKTASDLGYKISAIEKLEPKLLHARLAADIARREFGIADVEILKAIAEHTVGAENMSPLSKILYLADHMEEGRDFAGVERVRRLADKDLDQAIVESANQMLKHLIDMNLPIFEGTVNTRNYYLTHER